MTEARWLDGSGLTYRLDEGVHVLTAPAVAAAVARAWAAGLRAGLAEPVRISLTLGR